MTKNGLHGDGTKAAKGGHTEEMVFRDFEQMEGFVADAQQPAAEPQQTFFRITDNIPEEAWYWAALGSIGISALLKLAKKDDWAIFVGQWPPTFLLFGLYHRLVRPSRR